MIQSILLMEEHGLSRFAAAELLRDSGWTVTSACNETQALALLHKQRFDLLILGILTPSSSSLSLFASARLQWPAMQVIVIAAVPRNEIEETAFGAAHFLSKPVDVSQLLGLIVSLQPEQSVTK